MDYEIKSFDETTCADAKALTNALFDPKPGNVLDKILSNPLRRELSAESAGEIVYQDGRPVAFQAAIIRRLFVGQRSILGIVGSTLCSMSSTSPVLLMQLMKKTVKSRYGSELFFANTANVASMKMNRMLGVKGTGPFTCEQIRFGVIWVPKLLKRAVPSVGLSRLTTIDAKVFDAFWDKYRATNIGLVSSRSAEELQWAFGAGIANGKAVMLGHFDNSGALDGYIVLVSTHAGRRWMVMDWIALDNNVRTLALLIKGAVKYLRKYANGIFMEAIGFPDYADNILKTVLPFKRKTKNNSFLWKFDGKTDAIPSESWFFGPYDGDRMCGGDI